jgi:hypothetical protein
MIFKEIIPVYTENHKNPQIKNTVLNIVKTAETYNYH